MGKKGFYFDQSMCSGCRSCMLVCKENHHLPEGAFFRRVDSFVGGEAPKVGAFNLSLSCNHCMDPACIRNCPTGAMYVSEEDGTVLHDDEKCIGCKSCIESCPYDAPQYRSDLKIVQKCDGCFDLRAAGEQPDCVSSCLMRALTFDEIDSVQQLGEKNLSEVSAAPESETSPCTYVTESIYGSSSVFREWII